MVWGSQQSRPVTATGMSAAAAWHPEGDDYFRNQRQPVPLDVDPYGVPMGPRYTACPAHPVQYRLAKLDVFKGANYLN